MKTRALHRLFPLLLTLALAACATPQKGKANNGEDHEAHHPKTSAATPSGQGMGMGMMGSMDMKSMCDMHKNMMGGKGGTEEHMKSMPEMCRQHMQMMASHCKSA